MTAMNDPQLGGALDKIGKQIVFDAQRRQRRGRRRRLRLAVGTGLATLTIGGAVAASELGVFVDQPHRGPGVRSFIQHERDRIELKADKGLAQPWGYVVYRSQGYGFCKAIAPLGERARLLQCGAAVVTAEELSLHPITSVAAVEVPAASAGRRTVLVAGLADPSVSRVRVGGGAGDGADQAVDGATLEVPIDRFTRKPGDTVRVRPFLLTVPVSGSASKLRVEAVAGGGRVFVRTVRIGRP